MTPSLVGKVALVTGSTSGIGEATARLLASEGATVVINSFPAEAKGDHLARELPDSTYLAADVSDPDDAKSLVAHAVDHHGGLDIVVNNAGTTARIPHDDLQAASLDVWRRIMDVNLYGPWLVTAAAEACLRNSEDGCVVNVSSVAGIRARGSSIPYSVSKAGLNHLTMLLAKALGPEIRVNAVAPGLVDTPWNDENEAERVQVRTSTALKRSATPIEIAEGIIYLAKARFVTGEIVLVDGGLHLA
jgi:ketoreductase RED2